MLYYSIIYSQRGIFRLVRYGLMLIVTSTRRIFKYDLKHNMGFHVYAYPRPAVALRVEIEVRAQVVILPLGGARLISRSAGGGRRTNASGYRAKQIDCLVDTILMRKMSYLHSYIYWYGVVVSTCKKGKTKVRIWEISRMATLGHGQTEA